MKLKFGIKSIFKYLYLLILIVNFFLIYLIYDFTKKNVLSSINPDDTLMFLQGRKYSEDLNTQKFDEIISKIKQKKSNSVAPILDVIPKLDTATNSLDNF